MNCVKCRKSSKNTAKRFPEGSQDIPKPSQNLPKTPQDRPKTPPRRPRTCQDSPNARPKHPQDARRLPKTPPDSPKIALRPLQISIFDGLGSQQLRFFNSFPDHPACQASEHVRGDGGMRGAFESAVIRLRMYRRVRQSELKSILDPG